MDGNVEGMEEVWRRDGWIDGWVDGKLGGFLELCMWIWISFTFDCDR